MGNVVARGQLAGPLPRHDAGRQVPQQLAHGAAPRPGGAGAGAASSRSGARSSTARKDGLILQRDFGGHSYARLAHVGDRTGLEMIRTLQHHARAPGHRRLHGVHDHAPAEGRRPRLRRASATGARPGSSSSSRPRRWCSPPAGIGKAWKITSNSWEYTGDGMALALEAGRRPDRHGVRPVPPDRHGLAAQRARHPGHRGRARRRRRAQELEGERFMFNYIPEIFKAETARHARRRPTAGTTDKTNARRTPELLPRDVVARAINAEVKAGRGTPHGGVFLDIAIAARGRLHQAAAARRCTTSSRSWPTSTSPRSRWRSGPPATT